MKKKQISGYKTRYQLTSLSKESPVIPLVTTWIAAPPKVISEIISLESILIQIYYKGYEIKQ